MINKRENIAFVTKVPAGQTVTLKERVKGAATVEKLIARFYPGQQRSLQIRPIVMHGGGLVEPLVTYSKGVNPGESVSDNFLAGDDDRIEFDCSIPVANDEEIWVTATNTSTFDYDLVVYVMLDYLGGALRA